MKALILGYGRAGKRHSNILENLGIDWYCYDPYAEVPKEHYTNDLNKYYNFVVICSPPKEHLWQIQDALDMNVPVLCEKPLCDFGQLEQAKELLKHQNSDRVMMALNYRYHPDWLEVWKYPWSFGGKGWVCISEQYRESLPDWGLLLDHLPHTVDRLFWLGASPIDIESASQTNQTIVIRGTAAGQPLLIFDKVVSEPMDKLGLTFGPFGLVRPNASNNQKMFESMYNHFLYNLEEDLPFSPSLQDGIEVQEVLEKIKQCMGVRGLVNNE